MTGAPGRWTRTSRGGWPGGAGRSRSAGPWGRARRGPRGGLARASSSRTARAGGRGCRSRSPSRETPARARRTRASRCPAPDRRVEGGQHRLGLVEPARPQEEVAERDRRRRRWPGRARAPGAATPRRPRRPGGPPRWRRGRAARRTARTAASGSAPTNVSTTCPSRSAKTAGIDWTANAWATCGLSSTSTLASSTAPPVSATTFSRIGPSVLHGPHHSAQRSTTTGTVVDRSMTTSAKVASVRRSRDHCNGGPSHRIWPSRTAQ